MPGDHATPMPPPSLNDFLTAAPRLDVQLTLTVVLAVFWFAVFRVCTLYVVKPYIDAHPMSQQFAFLNQKMLKLQKMMLMIPPLVKKAEMIPKKTSF